MPGLGQIVREMRRRRVFRTAAIYIVGMWVLLEVIALAFQSFGIPDTALQYIWLAGIAGFPLALIFGWRYDITAEGIVRTLPAGADDAADLSLRNSDYIILIALAMVAVIFVGSSINEIRQGPLRGAGPWYAAADLATAIAVLPLENLSGDTDQEFLSAGLHAALITTLSRITRFRVTSRFSSRRVTGDMSLADIREMLGVDKILSGSVMREGDQVRVNVTLVDAQTEQLLWTESFTREFDGLISMQNEVASAVAREVKVQLTADEKRQLAVTDGPDSATYEAYLKGMFQLHKGSPRGYRRAIEIFTEAVENDPTSALAYAGLAIGYSQLGHSPYPVAGAYPRAKEAAQRALEYDSDLAEAYLAVGMYKIYYEWDFAGGEEAFLRALELNPSLVDAHYHYAWLLELLLRDEEAIEYGEYTKELNPLSPFYTAWLADQYRDAGMYEKAIAEAQITLGLNPNYSVAWLALGQTYLDMGRVDEAIEAHEHLRNNRFWGFAFAATLATAGRDEDAAAVLDFINKKENNPFTLSLIYGGLEDREETMKWMQSARDEKIPWFPWLVTWFPQTKSMHDDPRMQQFAAELGIEFPD
ncbi:MAG: tetratricopeptide repeat protein [Proteobacteria bacterium]|nr:tetratricopeptide repeat protein [Pseudomonadota bacterium]